ncbi:MAG: DUF3352 domain-containing protein [Phormidesmis sp.]
MVPAEKPAENTGKSAKKSKFARRLPKKPPKLLLVGAALLLGGGAIAYLNFVQRAPRSLSPAGTQLVPQTALATMTVTTDELAWTKLRQFGTAETQQQLDGLLKKWKKSLLTDNGYSFKRDIEPWIGDRVTLAVLSDKRSASGLETAAQNLVLVVPIADPLKAKALLQPALKDAAPPQNTTKDRPEDLPKNTETTSRSYKGVDVNTIQAQEGMAVESAVIGTSWLLLSNSPEAIEQAIDTAKGDRSLLDLSSYRKAATHVQSPQPPGKNFAQIYLNIPTATQLMKSPAGEALSDNSVSSGSIIPLQGSDGIVATVLIEPEGLRFQGTSWLSPKNDLAYSKLSNEASEMPRRLPDDTLVMISGGNLQRFWQGFSEGNSSPPFFPNPQNLKAGLLTQTGLDLDEDIMPWAAGEFALGVLPPIQTAGDEAQKESQNRTNSNEANAAGAAPEATQKADGLAADEPVIESAPLMMMVQTNDRQTAELAWAQLDDVMASRYRYRVETTEFEGGSTTKWISPFQGVQFSHGWLPGNVAFFAVGDGAAEQVTPAPKRPLAANRLFQTLTSQAPEPNNGHFYLDLAKINALKGGVFPLPELPEEGVTSAIQAIGLTVTVGDGKAAPQENRTMDYDLYVKLAKAAKPEPL